MKEKKRVYDSPFVQVFRMDRQLNIQTISGGGWEKEDDPYANGSSRYIPRRGNNESQIYHNPFLENKFKENPFGPSY